MAAGVMHRRIRAPEAANRRNRSFLVLLPAELGVPRPPGDRSNRSRDGYRPNGYELQMIAWGSV